MHNTTCYGTLHKWWYLAQAHTDDAIASARIEELQGAALGDLCKADGCPAAMLLTVLLAEQSQVMGLGRV